MASIQSNGTGGGNWDVGASWTGGVSPGSGDDVTIQLGDTITMTQAEAANTVANNGLLDFDVYTLTVTGVFTHDGEINGDATGKLICAGFDASGSNIVSAIPIAVVY